jgi:hypothetical protein
MRYVSYVAFIAVTIELSILGSALGWWMGGGCLQLAFYCH